MPSLADRLCSAKLPLICASNQTASAPCVGDVGTIVSVYGAELGSVNFDVESLDKAKAPAWRNNFGASEIEISELLQ
jgi:hypothetical protein